MAKIIPPKITSGYLCDEQTTADSTNLMTSGDILNCVSPEVDNPGTQIKTIMSQVVGTAMNLVGQGHSAAYVTLQVEDMTEETLAFVLKLWEMGKKFNNEKRIPAYAVNFAVNMYESPLLTINYMTNFVFLASNINSSVSLTGLIKIDLTWFGIGVGGASGYIQIFIDGIADEPQDITQYIIINPSD